MVVKEFDEVLGLGMKDMEEDNITIPDEIQKQVDSKLKLLAKDFRHPSLRAKKMSGYEKVWEARVTQGYRFTFEIYNDSYLLRKVGRHDILRKP